MKYDVIVIGAGVAGLFSAYTLAKNGKKVLLIEKQPVPGGFATTFKRKGFTFESAIHCVDQMGEGGEIFTFLREHGLDKCVEFIPTPDFGRLIYPSHDIVLRPGKKEFIESFSQAFPAEKNSLNQFVAYVDRFFSQFERYCNPVMPGWLQDAAMPVLYPMLFKASNATIEEFVGKYLNNPQLRSMALEIWRYAGLSPDKLSAFYFLMLFGGYCFNQTAHIRGGFMKLFEVMVSHIREAGSTVLLGVEVKKIGTVNGVVQKIVTQEGQEYSAPIVIANANPIVALTELLDDEKVRTRYRAQLPLMEKSISGIQVYVGLSCPAQSLGMTSHRYSINTSYEYARNFQFSVDGDYALSCIELTDHARLDGTLVPPGKGSLIIMTYDAYSHWKGLSGQEYAEKKEDVADILIKRVEKYLPGLSAKIEFKEVATPLTMERYTNSPCGAIYGFAQTVPQAVIKRLPQKTAIKGLYLAGGWTFPGAGVHGCFISAMEVSRLIAIPKNS